MGLETRRVSSPRYVFFCKFLTNDYLQIRVFHPTANGWLHASKPPTSHNTDEGAQTTVCRHLGFRYVFFNTVLHTYMRIYLLFLHIYLDLAVPKSTPQDTRQRTGMTLFPTFSAVGVFLIIFCILLLTRSLAGTMTLNKYRTTTSHSTQVFFITFFKISTCSLTGTTTFV
jgi:hypothetical protein